MLFRSPIDPGGWKSEVSNSFDVMGSANFGFPTAWVNRTGEPLDKLGPVPDLVIPDLERLAEALGA